MAGIDNTRNTRINYLDRDGGIDYEADKLKQEQERKNIKELAEWKLKLELQGIKAESEYGRNLLAKIEKKQKEQEKKDKEKAIKDIVDFEFKLRKEKLEQEKKERQEAYETQMAKYREELQSENATFGSNLKTMGKMIKTSLLGESGKGTESLSKLFNGFIDSVSQEMKRAMSSYAKYQSVINTRLQGSGLSWQGTGGITGISGLGGLQNALLTKVGINPYIKNEEMFNNLQKLVEQGIAFNLEQRTFLATISDKVAATFDAFDSNLSRIIRLQQADSTAARLGMEAYMTKFLNNMFSNTEYLNSSFDTVTQNLVEATSQMTTQMAVSFEYTTQKWLGSLASVGLSDSTISSLSEAIGYLATGNVTGMASSSMQNLIVMAASKAGLDYAEMLTRGISLDETNTLLGSVVSYLQEIGSSTNQVVKNQYAQTFGVSVADLRAALNLNPNDLKKIAGTNLGYGGAITELGWQMLSIQNERTSLAEKLSNVRDNAMYSVFSNIASNPALYALWEITDMIQGLTGGINIPGTMFLDLNTTVENLMKLGIIGAGSLGMIGDIVSGIGSTFAFPSVLSKLGINESVVTTSRGRGNLADRSSGFGTSTSSYLGNVEGDDFYKSTLSGARESARQEISNDQENLNEKTTTDIYQLLSDGKAKAIPVYDEQEKLDTLANINSNIISILDILRGWDDGGKVKTSVGDLGVGSIGFLNY